MVRDHLSERSMARSMAFVILIGASGSGKTAIAHAIASHYSREIQVYHFDHIGVPPAQQMIAEYGSGEAWQRAKTLEWIAKLASAVTGTGGVLFEGQTRPSFLAEAAAMGNIKYTLILIDCDDRTRARRLLHDRHQPELVTDDMMNWARYLRREAQAHGYEILDTSALPLHKSVAYVLARLRQNDTSRKRLHLRRYRQCR
jgi:shikimate kinase